MKAIFTPLLVLSTVLTVFAQQSIAPSVNNLAGIDAKVSDTFISTSIGESAITTLSPRSGGYITQGFLQPELLPCPDLEFKYYPNPARDYVNVTLAGAAGESMLVRLFNSAGQLLQEKNIANAGGTTVPLAVSTYPEGNYLIVVSASDGSRQINKLVITK